LNVGRAVSAVRGAKLCFGSFPDYLRPTSYAFTTVDERRFQLSAPRKA